MDGRSFGKGVKSGANVRVYGSVSWGVNICVDDKYCGCVDGEVKIKIGIETCGLIDKTVFECND